MAVLAVDVMTGSRLQLSSLMGLQPVVGGRFYGMGNTTFALFATSTILLCIAVSDHFVRRGQVRLGALAVVAIGLGATFIDGAPFWGADGGGPPALLPGLAFLVLSILGVTMTWKRGFIIAGVTVALFLLVGFLDWLRPVESRSHLGRFFQTMLDGGALDVITRKLDQNLSILFGSFRLALLVPIALAFVIYVLARPTSWGSRALRRSFDRATLRPGLIALLVTLTIGFAINDSGVAVPANGALIAVPLIIAVSVTALLDGPDRPGRRARPATVGAAHTSSTAYGATRRRKPSVTPRPAASWPPRDRARRPGRARRAAPAGPGRGHRREDRQGGPGRGRTTAVSTARRARTPCSAPGPSAPPPPSWSAAPDLQ